MRISELSRTTGVPIPTIKFYLREGLVPPGRHTAPNQAVYEETHARRLRLIRVLVDVGGLPLSAVARVIEALDHPEQPLHDALAAAHVALPHETTEASPELATARAETDAWLGTLGWRLGSSNPGRGALAAALAALRDLGWTVGPEVFERYAQHANALAEAEIEYVAASADREAALETAVAGTVIFERALSALRRLAHEHHSRRLLGGRRAR